LLTWEDITIVDRLIRRFIEAKFLDVEFDDLVFFTYKVSGVPQDVNIYGLRELLNEYGITLLEYRYKNGILSVVLDDDVAVESYNECGVTVEFCRLVKAIYDLQEFVSDIVLVSQKYSIENVTVYGRTHDIIVCLYRDDFEKFGVGMRQLGYVMRTYIKLSNGQVEAYFSSDGLPDRLRTICG